MILLVLFLLLALGQVPVHCEDADFIQELAARLAVLEKADQEQKLELKKQQDRLQQLQKENEKQNIKLSLQEQRIVELEETVLAQQRIINDHVTSDQGHMVSDQDHEVSDQEVGRPNIVSNAVESHDVQNADDEDISLIKNASPVSALKNVGKYFNVRPARFVAQSPEMVAFHATVDAATHVTKLTVGQTIVFDSVHINLSGGYHSSAGLFLAPTAGIYMFSVSVMLNTGINAWISLDLLQNGAVLAETYANGYDQGSVSVVTQLKVGDEVFVKLHGPNDAMFYGEKLTSFMGVLLIPM